MSRPSSSFIAVGLVLGACVGLAGCGRTGPGKLEQSGAATPTVTVSRPVRREVADYAEYPGRTAAVDSVEVRARVNGYLEKIHFKEGAEVKEGDVLYEIDPRPYRAALKQAEAQVSLQQAQLRYQEALYRRNVRLMSAGGAASREEVQQSLAQRNTTEASLNAARASVEQARLNLGWTRVEAPISGQIGRTLATRGNLVVADQTLLTTLVSQDPMYAYFDADEPTALRVQELIRQGKLASVREKGRRIPVYLGLATEQGYPHTGYLDFVSNQLNTSTATLQLRGVFPNPRPPVGPRVLAPGQFVRVRVQVSPRHPALLVIQDAVGTDQDLRFVYVLDADDKVVRRDVKLGGEHDGLQAVEEGLKADDRVVISGVQHVQPGLTVNPKLVPMPVPRKGALPRTPPAVTNTPRPKK